MKQREVGPLVTAEKGPEVVEATGGVPGAALRPAD